MRIIARSTLRAFAARYPQARQSLDDWYKFIVHVVWQTPADVKLHFRSADILPDNGVNNARPDRVVFNLGGNKYRLVVKIEYRFQTIYIRFVGTHAEYDGANSARSDRIDATTI